MPRSVRGDDIEIALKDSVARSVHASMSTGWADAESCSRKPTLGRIAIPTVLLTVVGDKGARLFEDVRTWTEDYRAQRCHDQIALPGGRVTKDCESDLRGMNS